MIISAKKPNNNAKDSILSNSEEKYYKIRLHLDTGNNRCWLGHSNASSGNGFYPTVKDFGKLFNQEALANDPTLREFLTTIEYDLCECTELTRIYPLRIYPYDPYV